MRLWKPVLFSCQFRRGGLNARSSRRTSNRVADAERAGGRFHGKLRDEATCELVSPICLKRGGRSRRGGRNITKSGRTAVWDTARRRSSRAQWAADKAAQETGPAPPCLTLRVSHFPTATMAGGRSTGAAVNNPDVGSMNGVRKKGAGQIHVYKTGDTHPIHNLLGFVEYCENGHAIWTTVVDDADAPFRLARKNGQHPPPCTCRKSRNFRKAQSRLREGRPENAQAVPQDVLLDKS